MTIPIVGAQRFRWVSFDVRDLLPTDWAAQVDRVVREEAVSKFLQPTSVTSREDAAVDRVFVKTVSGEKVKSHLGWLRELYLNQFLDLAVEVSGRTVYPASRDRIGVNLNVQTGNQMRYECHVDSNPIEGLLYLSSHPPGHGGELVVGNRVGATSMAEVDEDCTTVYPVAGNLIFFDARFHSHYVRPLVAESGCRVVAAMNFYTSEFSEAQRPADLDQHLFGSAG